MNVRLIATTEPNSDVLWNTEVASKVEGHLLRNNITAEQMIVYIARVSSSRVDKTEDPERLIQYLIKHKHWSPFEMADIIVEIETSRAISAHICRHWSMRFQEFSQRYAEVQEFEDIEFRMSGDTNRQGSTIPVFWYLNEYKGHRHEIALIPTEVEKQYPNIDWKLIDTLAEETAKVLETVEKHYNRLIESGIAPECARMILPMASKTKIYVKGNVRSWIHWIEARSYTGAQKEVRLIAEEILKLFKQEFPIISKALGW
jgi:thymidylate synthase (FAD)